MSNYLTETQTYGPDLATNKNNRNGNIQKPVKQHFKNPGHYPTDLKTVVVKQKSSSGDWI